MPTAAVVAANGRRAGGRRRRGEVGEGEVCGGPRASPKICSLFNGWLVVLSGCVGVV